MPMTAEGGAQEETIANLRKQKIKIGRTDLGLASIVLEQDATPVTENTRDFKQIPGLKIVSWSTIES